MTTNILLTKPDVRYPVNVQGYGGDVGIPLGLLYLASYTRQNNGSEIAIKDYRLDRALGRSRNLEADFNGFDVVATGACTVESSDALNILRQAKRMGKTTVIGGIYPTFNIERVLNTGYVDYIVRGEGEIGFSGLVDALEGKVSIDQVNGISYKRESKIISNPNQKLIENLDTLPMPAYDLIPVRTYAEFSSAPIYSTRGCPMSCKFCTLNEMWRFKQRKRSYGNIISELEMLKLFGFKKVHFKDESVTIDSKWAMGLFSEIERADLGLKYKAKSRVDKIEEGLVRQMVRAGLDTIHTGVESISENTQRSMNKGIKEETVRKAFDTVLNNGCKINPVYMFSYVGETEADLTTNVEFIEEMGQRQGVITYVSFITPHPGSGIDNEEGLNVLTHDLSRYTHKLPVAVPKSLGANGLRMMVDYYHRVAESTGMQEHNPRIDSHYLERLGMKGGLEIVTA
jgi:radical SAM superfamily enzyme YgiQ (UPF0313 family)